MLFFFEVKDYCQGILSSVREFCIFSSPEPKAHKVSLSDGHDPASICPSFVRPSSTISKIFFSETTWPILLKFYVEPPWVVALKV